MWENANQENREYGHFSCSVYPDKLNKDRLTVETTEISSGFVVWKFSEYEKFRRVLGNSAETPRKLCISSKFQHQKKLGKITILYVIRFQKIIRPLNIFQQVLSQRSFLKI